MARYVIEWIEHLWGEVEVEADDEWEARDKAAALIDLGDSYGCDLDLNIISKE